MRISRKFNSLMPVYWARRIGVVALYLVLSLIASGCASTQPQDTQVLSNAQTLGKSQAQLLESDGLRDLVSFVPQLLDSSKDSIQFNEVISGNAREVVSLLSESGFGVQRVDADQGRNFLRVEDITSAEEKAMLFIRLRLTIGSIELTRTYRTIDRSTEIVQADELNWRSDQTVIAAEPLRIAGTRVPVQVSGYEISAADRRRSLRNASLAVGSFEYINNAPAKEGTPKVSLFGQEIKPTVVRGLVQPLQTQTQTPSIPKVEPVSLDPESLNLNTFEPVTADVFSVITNSFNRVVRETVVFQNSNKTLDEAAKRQIRNILKQISTDTDFIGLAACSTGIQGLVKGNEGLAIDRAKSVAEELFAIGLNREQVFNEGCKSSSSSDVDVPRSVAIDLWRKKA